MASGCAATSRWGKAGRGSALHCCDLQMRFAMRGRGGGGRGLGSRYRTATAFALYLKLSLSLVYVAECSAVPPMQRCSTKGHSRRLPAATPPWHRTNLVSSRLTVASAETARPCPFLCSTLGVWYVGCLVLPDKLLEQLRQSSNRPHDCTLVHHPTARRTNDKENQ